MGIIRKQLEIVGDKGSTVANVLFDTGASLSLVRRDIAEQVSTLLPLPYGRTLRLGDGQSTITSTQVAVLSVRIEDKVLDRLFYVLDQLAGEVIIGTDFMQAWDISLEPVTETIVVRRDPNNIEFFHLA